MNGDPVHWKVDICGTWLNSNTGCVTFFLAFTWLLLNSKILHCTSQKENCVYTSAVALPSCLFNNLVDTGLPSV